MHRIGVALFGRRHIEPTRLFQVLGDAVALLVEGAEAKQRRRNPALGGALVPDGGLMEILRHAAPFGKARCDLVGGGGLARHGRGDQRLAADAGR